MAENRKEKLEIFCNARNQEGNQDHWGHGQRTQKPAGQRYTILSFSKLLIKKIITMS